MATGRPNRFSILFYDYSSFHWGYLIQYQRKHWPLIWPYVALCMKRISTATYAPCQACKFVGLCKSAKRIPVDTKDAGKLGGQKRAEKMTPEQRSEAARKAVTARWEKAKAVKRKPK
jgi:hypothetical protein